MIDPVSPQGVATEQQALNFLAWLFVSRASMVASSLTYGGLVEFFYQRPSQHPRRQSFR
jgi:hypothetical protein